MVSGAFTVKTAARLSESNLQTAENVALKWGEVRTISSLEVLKSQEKRKLL